MHTAQSVQERGTAAQHFCCHGEHGLGCLHWRGNRDLLYRYAAAVDLKVLMIMYHAAVCDPKSVWNSIRLKKKADFFFFYWK